MFLGNCSYVFTGNYWLKTVAMNTEDILPLLISIVTERSYRITSMKILSLAAYWSVCNVVLVLNNLIDLSSWMFTLPFSSVVLPIFCWFSWVRFAFEYYFLRRRCSNISIIFLRILTIFTSFQSCLFVKWSSIITKSPNWKVCRQTSTFKSEGAYSKLRKLR